MKTKRLFVVFALAGAALLLLQGWSSAQYDGGEAQTAQREVTDTQAIASTFSYQGYLEEGGNPVNGSRAMVFSLYGDGGCATQVGSAQAETVSIVDGLFDVDLDFDAAHFDGQALWLETEVEGTPIGCQPIQAAPYALTLRPGAVISASVGAEEQLLHARSGAAVPEEGVLGAKLGYRTALGYPVGIYAYAAEYGSVGVWGTSDSQFGWGVNGVAEGIDSIGVRGLAQAITSTTYGVYGEASSPAGFGGSFENSSSSSGVALSAVGPTGAVITGTEGTGLSAFASGNTGGDDAIRGEHSGGDGLVGFSDGPGNLDNGVIGFTDGGYGIYGFSNAVGQYGGYFDGPIFVNGGCTGCTMSYVSRNTSGSTLETGDIVRAAGVEPPLAGAQLPVMQVAAVEDDSTQVLGVVVGRTEMTMVEPGADDAQPGPHYGPVGGAAQPGDYLVVAVQGMVQVKVDAAASVRAGDSIGLDADGLIRTGASSPLGMVLERPDEAGLAWVLLGFD